MVTLASLDGASLVPDTVDLLSSGLKFGRQVKSDVLTPDLIQRVQAGDQSAVAELSQLNPAVLQNFLSAQTKQANLETGQREQRIAKAKEMITSARSEAINTISDVKFVLRNGPEGIRNAMAQLVARQKDDPNFDTEQAVELANLATSDPDQAMRRLQDISDGAQAELEVADQILSQTSKIDQVQSAKVLPDGTTVQVMRSGATRVTNPGGQPVTGPARAQAIKTAQEFGVKTQTKRAGGRAQAVAEVKLATEPTIAASTAAAKAAIKRSEDAFDKIAPIKRSIANIDEAISLIDQGAETGVIAARLPSVRSASIQLDNLQGKLGLDVISNTTFGALSAPELKFALSTALPKTLEGPELKKWLQRKKEAQQKLAAYLERVAVFLGTPGNTVKDFIELEQVNQLDREAGVEALPPGLPAGTTDNGDGTFTLPDGQIVEPE